MKAHFPEPRGFSKAQAAVYLGVSEDTIERLIASGTLPVLQFPVTRVKGAAVQAANRRVLVDRKDCDALIDASRVSRGQNR